MWESCLSEGIYNLSIKIQKTRQKDHFIIFIALNTFLSHIGLILIKFIQNSWSYLIQIHITMFLLKTWKYNYVRLMLASGNIIPYQSINQRDFYRSIRQNLSPERSATLPIGDLAKTSPPTEKLEAGWPVGEDTSSLEKERDIDVESLLICIFFLAPRDQLQQRNEPATSQAAGYPQAAGYQQPAGYPCPIVLLMWLFALAETCPKDIGIKHISCLSDNVKGI